jgi:hypothetical protein
MGLMPEIPLGAREPQLILLTSVRIHAGKEGEDDLSGTTDDRSYGYSRARRKDAKKKRASGAAGISQPSAAGPT